ncbi:hypothetical protein EOA27_00530 [Mesorhizobium sp. M2A.F.Ca.ET.037.01.1.1]|uniref:hypothetical protein n=1 Tax=unclassified Mesorhizobium TaxID=325217 RepID=UPI000F754797|nr:MULTISPECIES: hypothetical protein [unclassified Mesorhizobium]RUY13118.1 hypothetical protein EOA25_01430 [Mesorhizobium sp. M2A.F.Ca.ET.040.01.1.1]AZO16056.1 hypothetical protein EJ069_15830 [Mesorhizobium sp. M2A.F.Ca.ET.043.05.1.1]RUX23391.1 hypothetical protein EOA27_00530 [Mesorhizobium sp. M2A.F.Ca.ET.037.01.1.1]RWA89222.1 MAG: hypothetical protein EOQ31_18540 [Mesorhizobium sp.]RWE85347.1 MAG: hypothetical protein EOS63_01545 [Mesorhizobium sp.]
MTAEIAILNRSAVALAADSVLTLVGSESGKKTFDSAEKIFELTRYQPIGLMIYNNATFMNVPLEVLIRRYRETLTLGAFRVVAQARSEFERFLLGFKASETDRMEHFQLLLNSEIATINKTVLNEKINALLARKKKRPATLRRIAEGVIANRIAELKKIPLKNQAFMKDVTFETFMGQFESEIRTAVEAGLKTTMEEIAESVLIGIGRLMFCLLKSETRSQAYTGLVFAGLGSDDLFPSLESVELDGVYFGQARTLNSLSIDIDRAGPTSRIVPFAQTDMAERFIHGIDRTFERGLQELMSDVVGSLVERLGGNATGNSAALVDETLTTLRQSLSELKDSAEAKLNSVVNHMSRKELGELAYSLVELTSRKRRYSTEIETVGGPIDVAILTKNEGFIWVKRKHYFDLELNPRFRSPKAQY